ncbi:MAG: zinc ribbon domain-containing protein [Clostridia bacterium]|nr:zinc ribbon domain-containing protein [Clostridia bacterium]
MVCPKCGKTNEDSRVYCYQCNEMLAPSVKSDSTNVSKRRDKIHQEEIAQRRGKAIKANKKRKIRLGRVIVFAVILVIIVVGAFFAIRKITETNVSKLPVYYLKNDMLMAMNYADGREYIISETPAIDPLNYDGTGIKEGALKFTQDYKYCYFLQSGDDASGYTLCKIKVGVTDANEEDGTLVKIDTNVIEFEFSENGKKVIYKKVGVTEGVGRLYYFDGSNSYGIADNVYDYRVNSDFTVAFYTKHTDGQIISLYEVKLKKPEKSNKICDNVEEITSFGDNVVYVAKVGGEQYIYSKEYGKDPTELGKGKSVKIEKVFEDAVYYSEATEMTLSTKTVIADNMAESDAAITEPKPEDFENVFDYDEALKRYDEKLLRDNIRKYFEENPIKVSVYNLYVYKNGQTTVIDGTVSSIVDYCKDGSVIYVKMSSNLEKTNITDYDYGYDLEKEIIKKFAKSGVLCVHKADNTKISVTDENVPHTFEGAVVSGDYIYYIAKKSVLFCYNTGTKEITELSSDVSELVTTDNPNVLYAVYNYKTAINLSTVYRVTKAEMQFIVDDAVNYSIIDDSNIIYVKCEQGKDYGTLYLNTNKKNVEIDSSVYAYRVIARNVDSILYFKNFTEQSGYTPKADLYWYKDEGAATKSDYNVSSIIF